MNLTISAIQPEQCSGALNSIEIVVLATLNTILALVSTVGNALVLLAIYRVPSQKTVSNAFLASLGVADFSVGVIMNPLWVYKSVLNIWQSDNIISTVIEVVAMQTVVATSLSLCAVSLDRYIAVTNIRHNEILTCNRVRTVIISIWIFSVIFASLRLVVTDPFELPKLWIAATTITVILPCLVISICYFYMVKAARVQIKRITKNEAFSVNGDEAVAQLKNSKAVFTVGIVVGVFLVCWTPSLVISFVQFFCNDPCKRTKLNGYWFWGALAEFSNSAFNPFIYCMRMRDFRKAVKRVLFTFSITQFVFGPANSECCS
ncbi:Beta-1 adrenergic receptor [Acropora cervicornis]|uniref:Beta-1 adrenergic receptor n=1 Tax=Acropora cervicornis TaxID=6130 RepID=A0AAD9V8G4_ACRCE|nr:Beta-1 adrenergic receptor [Acropora cervicornis]